jgi:hypothetical protein
MDLLDDEVGVGNAVKAQENRATAQYGYQNGGWGAAIWLTLIGLIAGIGMAKTGFGTECAMTTPEIPMGLNHDRKRECSLFEGQWQIAAATRYMFGSMSLFTAIFIELVILWAAIMIGWQMFGRELRFANTATPVMTPCALMQGFGFMLVYGVVLVRVIVWSVRTGMRLSGPHSKR